MKKKIVILAIAIIALVSYGVYLGFFSMNRLPKGKFISEVKSPDKKYSIKVYVSEKSTTAPAIRCELNYIAEQKKPKNIYWNYKEDNAVVQWIDNETVIINQHKLNVFKDTYDWRKEN